MDRRVAPKVHRLQKALDQFGAQRPPEIAINLLHAAGESLGRHDIRFFETLEFRGGFLTLRCALARPKIRLECVCVVQNVQICEFWRYFGWVTGCEIFKMLTAAAGDYPEDILDEIMAHTGARKGGYAEQTATTTTSSSTGSSLFIRRYLK